MKGVFSAQKKFLLLGIFSAVLVFGFGLFSSTVFGQDVFGVKPIDETTVLGGQDIRVTVVKIINVALGLLGIVVLGLILYAGYMYMTAGGNEEKVATAKKILINATIGLVIILSSFAITQFVLNKLKEATGINPPPRGDCTDPAYYLSHLQECRDDICDINPAQCFEIEHFIVKSITPSTPTTTDSTGLYNDTIRVLFSKIVTQSEDDIFKILYTSSVGTPPVDSSDDFEFSSINQNGNTLVEAVSKNPEECNGQYTCLEPGIYQVIVSGRITDTSGDTVESFPGFPLTATFNISAISNPADFLDTTAPTMDSLIFIDPVTGNALGSDNMVLVEGKKYNIQTNIDDRITKGNGHTFGGNALIDLQLYEDGVSNSIKGYKNGPQVGNGSSPIYNNFKYTFIPFNLKLKTLYEFEATGYDIDGNTTVVTSSFKVIPAGCDNGKIDPELGETADGVGGDCDTGGGPGAKCAIQDDCSKWYKCLEPTTSQLCDGEDTCVCTAWPYIEDVKYMNGAEGNWITITGYNFGTSTGSVFFNFEDLDKNGKFEGATEKSQASFPECKYGKVWNDSWIIAEVPSNSLATGKTYSTSSISVVAKNTGFEDFTIDDGFGPIIGDYDDEGNPIKGGDEPDGLFEYNDTERPGLCSVTVEVYTEFDIGDGKKAEYMAGTSKAPPNTKIIAEGKGFGTSKGKGALTFDSGKNTLFTAFVGTYPNSWTNDTVKSIVPFAKPGKNSVYVTADSGKISNPAMFEVVDLSKVLVPVITQIDPATTTRGSLITIYGSNFGSSGTVTIGGVTALKSPEFCGNTWKDDQIIIKVPKLKLEDGINTVVVTRDDGVSSKADDDFVELVAGDPLPSICKLEPSAGPAPLPDGGVLTILGENFSTNPTVYFWSQVAQANNVSTWLSSGAFGSPNSTITNAQKAGIVTAIPVDKTQGFSMMTGPGPIKVKNDDGQLSNSIKYTVTDCRESDPDAIPGFHCCTEGEEIGNWKQDGFMCVGEDRDAGYVWRFTTGKIANKFYVKEQCDTSAEPPLFPSPSPWAERPQGKTSCVNALIVAKFSLPIDETTIADMVKIFSCGIETEIQSCDTNVSSEFSVTTKGFSIIELKKKDMSNLEAETWYRIAFSKDLQSQEIQYNLGVSEVFHQPLFPARPCDTDGDKIDDAAYCFEFRTGKSDNICSLVDALMDPDSWTTSLLGVIQNPAYGFMYELESIFNPGDPNINPQFFDVFGIASQECTLMDVDDKPWNWGPSVPSPLDSVAPATSERYPTSQYPTSPYENSRGIAKAWKNSAPNGSDIFATVYEENKKNKILPILGSINGVDGIFNTVTLPYNITTKEAGLVVEAFVPALEGDVTFYANFTLNPLETSGDHLRYLFRKNIVGGNQTYLNLYFLDKIVEKKRLFNIEYAYSSLESSSFYIDIPLTANTFDLTILFKTDKMIVDIITNEQNYHEEIEIDTKNLLWKDANNYTFAVGTFAKNSSNILAGSIQSMEFKTDLVQGKEITATSTIIVDLGNPKVVSKWPSCTEACINASIGAQFNQIMAQTYYDEEDIELYRCADETCLSGLTKLDVVYQSGNGTPTILQVNPEDHLATSTWYLAKVVSSTLYGLGGISDLGPPPVGVLGKQATPTQWKFKTKSSSEPCVVDSVKMYPDPFTAYFIGQKKQYNAQPKGAPDSCSPYGQFLNPWDYGWNWSVANPNVATTTKFALSKNKNPFCSNNCLPVGSDVSRDKNQVVNGANAYSICGNGFVDAGEDCDIAITGEVPGDSCTYSCLRPGNKNVTSTVLMSGTTPIDQLLCGDGVVSTQLGEECDPNDPELVTTTASGEKIDYSPYCSNTCLWTGSEKPTTAVTSTQQTNNLAKPICGSGSVTTGEDCDGTKGCSSSCLNVGTYLSQEWCDAELAKTSPLASAKSQCTNAVSVCGNGELESGEECDDDDSKYCSDSCLVQTAPDGSTVCDALDDESPNPLKQCNAGEEGCNDNCTLKGSSVTYSTPSLCGDGSTDGIGEYYGNASGFGSCEVVVGTSFVNDLGENPVQIVTAVGDQNPNATPTDGVIASYDTTINSTPINYLNPNGGVSSTDGNVTGSGDYSLMCGFTEYVTSTLPHNDCPNNDSSSGNNKYGVASNSCCSERPVRVDQYPAVNAGISGTEGVCRNTLIEVQYDRKMDGGSFKDNVLIVQGYRNVRDKPAHQCDLTKGHVDVTEEVNQQLFAMNGNLDDSDSGGFWNTLWNKLKRFFAGIFGVDVLAVLTLNSDLSSLNITWCTSNISVDPQISYEYAKEPNGGYILDAKGNKHVTTSTVSLYIDKALDPHVYVAVILEGGPLKIRDASGIPIKSPFTTSRDDYWLFKTRGEICKIDHVDVKPDQHLFEAPFEEEDFKLEAITAKSEKIVKLAGVYDWESTWHPQNPLFSMSPTTTEQTTVTSQGIEGHVDGVGKVTISADIFPENPQLGKVFTDVFGLTAFYCGNPWPSNLTYVKPIVAPSGGPNYETEPKTSNGLFEDIKYNFLTRYCADDANPLSTDDDLPLFDTIIPIVGQADLGSLSGSTQADTLRRYLFFSSTTEDVIGIQVFKNEPKLDGTFQTLREWYMDKFGELGNMQLVSVGGYEALTDGTNYYVSAYNVGQSTGGDYVFLDTIYRNVYLFGINQNASEKTINVFTQLIENLEFNINLSNHNKCVTASAEKDYVGYQQIRWHNYIDDYVDSYNCTTDLDCRTADGTALPNASGFCSNQKTKFFRDLTRLQNLSTAQGNLDKYFDANFGTPGFVGNLASGSYLPGYSNSKWNNSWSLLNQKAGAIPVDPVNDWRGCSDHDPSTCWNSTSSTFKCPQFAQVYEYAYASSTQSYNIYAPFEFITTGDTYLVNQFIDDRVLFDRSCEPDDLVSLYATSCGDGILSPAFEECDPPGKTKIVSSYSCSGLNAGKIGQSECVACKWSAPTCVAKLSTCGNGTVEAGEKCDDGTSNNGKYGFCNKQCSGSSGFCGNGELDYEGTKPLEFCDSVGGVCKYISDSSGQKYAEAYILLDRSETMNDKSTGKSFTRWKAALDGLDAVADKFFSTVDIGLAVFSGPKPGTTGGKKNEMCNPLELLALADNTSEQIKNSYSGILSNGTTPTADALKYVYQNRDKIFSKNTSISKNIILITDGKPWVEFLTIPTAVKDCETFKGFVAGQGVEIAMKNTLYWITQLEQKGYDVEVVGFDVTDAATKDKLKQMAEAAAMEKYYTADTPEGLLSVFDQILGCKEYNPSSYGSCSWDCQSYGGYCGDKIIQWDQNEQCDDGNTNNDDACKNNCTKNDTPSVCGNGQKEGVEQCDDGNLISGDGCSSSCQIDTVTIPICGDGEINQESEQCDLGTANNGNVCTPDYNSSCSYCRNDCKVELIESPYQCGNGVVDFKDINGNLIYDDSSSDELFEECDYTLNSDGTQKVVYLYQIPWTCELAKTGVYQNDDNQILGTISCDNTCHTMNTSKCIECGRVANGATPKIAFLNVMTGDQGDTKYHPSTWSEKTSFKIYTHQKKSLTGKLGTGSPAHILDDYSLLNTYGLDNAEGLQIADQCSDFYQIRFNPDDTDEGHYFPYSAPSDEIVVSPALPPGDMRIVVRWDRTKNPDIKFVGNIYTKGPGFFTYVNQSAKGNLCNWIEPKGDGYWKPPLSPACPIINGDNGHISGAWVHGLTERGNTGIQAYTISNETDRTFAFYVSSLNGPINQFKDFDVWVDVYYSQSGQDATKSIYNPYMSFSLKQASGSENSTAAYWHVFNIKKVGSSGSNNKYRAYKTSKGNFPTEYIKVGTDGNKDTYNGTIRNDGCDIKDFTPGALKCPSK